MCFHQPPSCNSSMRITETWRKKFRDSKNKGIAFPAGIDGKLMLYEQIFFCTANKCKTLCTHPAFTCCQMAEKKFNPEQRCSQLLSNDVSISFFYFFALSEIIFHHVPHPHPAAERHLGEAVDRKVSAPTTDYMADETQYGEASGARG